MYRSMDDLQSNEDLRAQLKDIALVPLVNGQIVSLQQCSVFFPLDQEERRKKLKKDKGIHLKSRIVLRLEIQMSSFGFNAQLIFCLELLDPLLALERDLNSVHPLLMNTDDQIANSQVARLLEQLGVKKLTPNDVIHHHILPVLKEEHLWKVHACKT